jgi:purine-binding chemotaxis protein CheW
MKRRVKPSKQRRKSKKKPKTKLKIIKPVTKHVLPKKTKNDIEEISYATFMVGKEYFAIDLDSIAEILHEFNIVSVPHLPDTFSGVIELRGESIPVVDLQKLLAEEKITDSVRTCLITIINSSHMGLLVDSDIEIMTESDGRIHPLPDCYIEEEIAFLDGIFWVEDKFFGILKPKEMIEILAKWRHDNEEV